MKRRVLSCIVFTTCLLAFAAYAATEEDKDAGRVAERPAESSALRERAAPEAPSEETDRQRRITEHMAEDDRFQPEHPFGPLPERLDEMIEMAMHRNPDIRIAEAAQRQAEAQLYKARLEVTQEVARLYIERQQVRQAISDHLRTAAQHAPAQAELAALNANLAELDARTRYLLGLGAFIAEPERGTAQVELPMRPAPRPEMKSAEIRQTLEQAYVSMEFDDKPLAEVLEFLSDYVELNIVTDFEVAPHTVGHIEVRDVPLESALLALADQAESLCFVIRDTFILATTRERAARIAAPTIPPDVPLFVPEMPPHDME